MTYERPELGLVGSADTIVLGFRPGDEENIAGEENTKVPAEFGAIGLDA